MVLGPNTLVGLATLAPGADKSTLVARLVPAYVDLLKQLKVGLNPCLSSSIPAIISTITVSSWEASITPL